MQAADELSVDYGRPDKFTGEGKRSIDLSDLQIDPNMVVSR